MLATTWGFGTAPVHAQQQDAIDYTQYDLESLLNLDVVYGASKYEQKINEAPANVAIVTAEDIRRYGYQSLAEVLNSLGGFYITNDHNYDYAGIRGFGRPADYNSRILLLVDGLRINDPVCDSASIGREFPIDLDLIQRIEVVRGPNSSLYGTNAFFAIVNVITRTPSAMKGLQGAAQVASHAGYGGRLSYGRSWADGLDLMVSATHSQVAGYDHYFPEFDDPTTNNGVFENGDEEKWTRLFARSNFGGFSLTAAYSWQEKVIPTAAWDVIFNDNRTKTGDNIGFVTGSYSWDISDHSTLNAQLGYHQASYTGDWAYDYAEEETDPFFPVVMRETTKGQSIVGEVKWTADLNGEHKLIIGGEHRNNFQIDQRTFDVAPYWSYLDDRRQTNISAVYGLFDWHLHPKLNLNLGARHDYYDTWGGTTNPRVALIARPRSGSVMKFMAGSAFRAPSAYETYYHDGFSSMKPPVSLEPETIDTYEVSWEQEYGGAIESSLSFFHYDIEGLIEQVTDPEDDLLVFTNLQQVAADGFECELKGRTSGGARGRLSYSYQDTRDEADSRRLINSPLHLFKMNVVMPLKPLQTFAALELQYVGSRRTVADNQADGFLLTNLNLDHQDLLPGLSVHLGVRNLFEVEYGHPGGGEHLQDILMQDGRTWRLTLVYWQ